MPQQTPSTTKPETRRKARKVFDLPTLDPAQRAFFADDSRVQVVCWHRQKGKDFTTAAKAVSDALQTGRAWYIVSLTQRQADATFEKCVWWARKYKAAVELSMEAQGEQFDASLDQRFEFKARELQLPGGGKVISLPGRDPDTLAGLTGNVIFTEFGLFPGGGYKHWRVVFPLSTRGFHVIAISTPRGKNTKFHELVSDPDTYSVHFCDIHRSVREGFVLKDQHGKPTDIDTFRKLYGDEAGWQREYECHFTGELDALVRWNQLQAAGERGRDLPFDLLRIENDSGWSDNWLDGLDLGDARLEVGWDVARRGHLSAVTLLQPLPGGGTHFRGLVLLHNTSFELQRRVVRTAMKRPRSVGCGDATGLGLDSNETLTAEFGSRWSAVTFTAKTKSELGSGLATAFGDAAIAIPPMDGPEKFIGVDVYGVQAEDTGGQDADKRLRLVETENALLPESHCDIAWSLALALRAGAMVSTEIGAIWL